MLDGLFERVASLTVVLLNQHALTVVLQASLVPVLCS